MLEIIMLVMGIVVLIRGRMSTSKTKEIRGPIARLVGLIMVAPVPIVLIYAVATGKGPDDGAFGQLFMIELGAVLTCFVLAMIVAYSNAEPKEDQARTRGRDRFADEDDYDDRRSRRSDDEYDRDRRRGDDEDDRDYERERGRDR